jgi:hypothetical protein
MAQVDHNGNRPVFADESFACSRFAAQLGIAAHKQGQGAPRADDDREVAPTVIIILGSRSSAMSNDQDLT